MGRTCVFCSSSPIDDHLHSLARELGAAIVRGGDELVYGGTTTGLMGEVAAGARGAGGRVIGVVPATIAALGSVDDRCDELVEVETMGERKEAMMRASHRFVVLPGGIGTLDELLEVMTYRQLGLIDSHVDIVLLDPDGHWDALVAQLDSLVAAGTARSTSVRVRHATTVADALAGPGPGAAT